MKLWAVLAMAIAACACGAPVPTSSSVPSPSATPSTAPAGAWRLVAAADRGVEWAYSVHAATSAADWAVLWGQISPGLDLPEIDFGTEIATVFADGTGGAGNCSERRLDGVVIDVQQSIVYSEISDPLAPRGCDALLGGSSIFVVAIARAALPPVAFTLRLRRERMCGGNCADQVTVDPR